MRRDERFFQHNQVLKLVLGHAAFGALLGLLFTVFLVLLDAHGLGTLLRRSDSAVVAFVLLAGGFMITFGSLVAGSAVMMMSSDHDDGPGGGGGGGRRSPVPVRVRSRPPR